MKVTMLYPPDSTTSTVNDMHLLYLQALNSMRPEFEIQIIGRIPEPRFRQTVPTTLPYLDFFSQGSFNKTLNQSELADAERQIGMPYEFLFACNQRRWGWLDKNGCDQKVARYVPVWQKLLKGTDALITTLDNLFFIQTAEGVASKMGIPIIKPISGRLVNNSVVFWDRHNLPIFHTWDIDSKNDIYDRFAARTSQKAQVRLHTSSITSTSGFISKISSIPNKIRELQSSPPADADIPRLRDKYLRLSDIAMMMQIFPGWNRILCKHPHPNDRYFLFALHFEWEANMAAREPFTNQLQLAETISKCLPSGTKLYIKTPPHWKSCDQYPMDMYRLYKQPNVRIIHPSSNTTDLINNSIGVIAINSTVGYEALLAKKPLLAIGHEWFKEAGINIKDLNTELPAALMAAANDTLHMEDTDLFLRRYAANIVPIEGKEIFAAVFRKVILHVRGR